MKKIIILANEEEFNQFREKYKNALYYESQKYKKLRLSSNKEVRCFKK